MRRRVLILASMLLMLLLVGCGSDDDEVVIKEARTPYSVQADWARSICKDHNGIQQFYEEEDQRVSNVGVSDYYQLRREQAYEEYEQELYYSRSKSKKKKQGKQYPPSNLPEVICNDDHRAVLVYAGEEDDGSN